MGFLSFFGGLFWLVRRVFSGFWGFLCFSFVLLHVLGWGAGCGGFRGSGFGAPGCLASFSWGWAWGAPARARFLSCPVLAVVGVGGRVRGVRVARLPAVLWWGSGCARFPVRVRGVVVVFAGGFRVLFFPSGASRVLLVSGVGLRGLAGGWGLWGVSGWVRGCFFSGFCCTGPGLFPVSFVGAGLGLGWVLFGEFDPGSGRTLAACLTHASRTGPPLWGWVEWRTGEYHVSNLPPAPG